MWATPSVMDHRTDVRKPEERSDEANKGGCANLREQVMWATPNTMDHLPPRDEEDCSVNQKNREGRKRSGNLREQVVHPSMWPTPNANDNRDRGHLGTPSIQKRRKKGKQLDLSMVVSKESGALNPTWVEWLMGYPLGWTDSRVWETQSSHK